MVWLSLGLTGWVWVRLKPSLLVVALLLLAICSEPLIRFWMRRSLDRERERLLIQYDEIIALARDDT